MNDQDFHLKELLRYSRYVSLNQKEPSPDRLSSNQLTHAEQNRLCNLSEDFTPPTQADVVNAVTSIVMEIAPHRASPVMNKGRTMINTVYDFFNSYGSLETMPARQQDIFIGMCRNPLTDNDNTHFSAEQIFMLLKAKKTFNNEDVANWLNIKRRIRGYRDCDVGMSKKIVKKITHIMQAWDVLGLISAANSDHMDLTYDPYTDAA